MKCFRDQRVDWCQDICYSPCLRCFIFPLVKFICSCASSNRSLSTVTILLSSTDLLLRAYTNSDNISDVGSRDVGADLLTLALLSAHNIRSRIWRNPLVAAFLYFK